MMGYSKNSLDYIRIQLMIAALGLLITDEQGKRVLKAAEWNGFDAGMKSLTRVADQRVTEIKGALADKDTEIASDEEAWRTEEKKRFELEERIQDLYLDGKISYEALWIALECKDAEVMDEGLALRAQARERKRLSTLTRDQLEQEPETYLVACELESRFNVPLPRAYLSRRIMEFFI